MEIILSMINQNILSMFKSHASNPSFSILITDIETVEECGQEGLIITVHQIDKPLSLLEENTNITSRKLHIMSGLDTDDDNLYKSKLIGYISDEKKETQASSEPGVFSHSIEMLDTKLQKEISVEFNKSYEKMPKIITNIDKQYESLYRSISIEPVTKVENDITYYTGAKLTFNGLKTKKSYPIISIIILGDDKIDEISLFINNNTGQKGDNLTLKGRALDEEGNFLIGKEIKFYADGEYWDVDYISIEADKNIIQKSEEDKIRVSVINTRGNKLEDKQIILYWEKENETNSN